MASFCEKAKQRVDLKIPKSEERKHLYGKESLRLKWDTITQVQRNEGAGGGEVGSRGESSFFSLAFVTVTMLVGVC